MFPSGLVLDSGSKDPIIRVRSLPLAALLCASTGSAIAQTATTDAEATAHRVLDQLDAGDYAAVTATFYPQMTAALSADALRQVQTQIEAAGPVTSRNAPRGTQQQGMTVVVTRFQLAQASLDASVALDAEGRVAGLHFAPVAATP
ncbi:DUF3887 domain-containing protein [Luteimonas sp. 3794]|uniref:DUF3887 domain-containing protein n=1 Tax=Luteimonas sp. 3794 TaxID=2817730 RepID=UPI00285D6E50|nr:DUF3887 domain-containing protein [Luteimonas sp. 3794]MDR6992087.1 hypothetical protein [Luteimonas sp. 3794]